MLSNVQLCSLNNHFSNFSSKAAPQTPLDVIHVIRKNIRKVNTNKMLGKKLGKSQQSCSLKNQKYKSCLMVSVTYFVFLPAHFLLSNWESQQWNTFMRYAVSYMYLKQWSFKTIIRPYAYHYQTSMLYIIYRERDC